MRVIIGIIGVSPAILVYGSYKKRLPKAAVSAAADTQVELHTDRNQTLAQVQGALSSDDDGRSHQGFGATGLSHHGPRRGAESAGAGPVPVQAAARGKSQSLRSVRPLASGRSRRLCEQGRRNPRRAERRFCHSLPRALAINVMPRHRVSPSGEPDDRLQYAAPSRLRHNRSEYWIIRFRG